ncbi:MAG TPA: ribonuclease [Gallionella sp.]|nr:ribonuclease [Gallionella sp.]
MNSRLIALFAVVFALVSMPAEAGELPPPGKDAIGIIAVAELPAEARDTLRAIKQGGPFAYSRDGVVFKNYERVLPKQPRGYYREYTVKTPGARNRGARRIVCGHLPECYYSPDHYRTFKRIRE